MSLQNIIEINYNLLSINFFIHIGTTCLRIIFDWLYSIVYFVTSKLENTMKLTKVSNDWV